MESTTENAVNHASDCAHWVGEACDCITGNPDGGEQYDADDFRDLGGIGSEPR